MKPADFLRAIVAPVVESTVLLPLLLFWVLLSFAVWALTSLGPGAAIGGILILLLSLPPMYRFQTFVVESYANGRAPDAFDAQHFSVIGNMWALFPLVLSVLIGYASYRATAAWGTNGAWLVVFVAALVYPACLAVLAITHSALQALNPIAIYGVYDRAGMSFLAAPAYILVLTLICFEVAPFPTYVGIGIGLFMMYSVATLTGTLIAGEKLIDDVYIPEALEADEEKVSGDVQKLRESVLAHAYGFISRNNRDGGFKHVFGAIEEDPNPVAAWDWYLNSMFRWENTIHAQFFAQHYIQDALKHGEDIRALKVAMRCYHENEQFRPRREDIPALIEAAQKSGNTQLADVLNRS